MGLTEALKAYDQKFIKELELGRRAVHAKLLSDPGPTERKTFVEGLAAQAEIPLRTAHCATDELIADGIIRVRENNFTLDPSILSLKLDPTNFSRIIANRKEPA